VSFARFGVRGLVVADIDLDAAKATVVECQSVASNRNLRAEAVSIDVALEDSVSSALKQVVDKLGRIDYCVHAAGVRVTRTRLRSRIADSRVR
jgi:NAD(P)-dependent dehydrogenase (short-subunit alcohol dehydrogenase family)